MLVNAEFDISTLAAAQAPDEEARVAALHAYSILDTPVEAAFEDITLIASHVCGTPIAVVNLIDATRQWFKSERGLGVRETPLATSICAHAILESDFLEVPDTRADPRFNCNPLVTDDPGLRFYAGALLRTPDGHALGTICVLDHQPRVLDQAQRDVLFALARQTMAQLELRRAVAQSNRSLETQRRIMAVAGHDLRNPLSLVELALHHVASVAPLDADSREEVEIARRASRDLAVTLDRLAEASQMGGERTQRVPVDLQEFMTEVSDRWTHSAHRVGRDFRSEVDEATLTTDPEMLRTIVDNLISNALEHAADGPIVVRASQDADATWIAVEDAGPGIPAEHPSRIFEAFQQLDARCDGLGLGLSIVQRTAELLGAVVNVDSQAGRGTRFTVRLPR